MEKLIVELDSIEEPLFTFRGKTYDYRELIDRDAEYIVKMGREKMSCYLAPFILRAISAIICGDDNEFFIQIHYETNRGTEVNGDCYYSKDLCIYQKEYEYDKETRVYALYPQE